MSFRMCSKDDPNNLLATQSVANLYYQMGNAKGPDAGRIHGEGRRVE